MSKPSPDPTPNALARHVLETFRTRITGARGMFVLGLSGPQGSGKSTLARALVRAARTHGIPAQTLSLDDVYLGRRARRALARAVHPLLCTRGVPGTHDLDLLRQTLQALPLASPDRPVRLPRFDKGRDTRRPAGRWPQIKTAPRLLVLEGWCVDVPAQSASALRRPVNALERREDPEGAWRRYVNRQLRAMQPVWKRLDARVVLTASSWPQVCRWRAQAEQPLRERHAPHAMDARQLARFMQHFERLGRHAAATLPARADVCIRLDAARRMTGYRVRRR